MSVDQDSPDNLVGWDHVRFCVATENLARTIEAYAGVFPSLAYPQLVRAAEEAIARHALSVERRSKRSVPKGRRSNPEHVPVEALASSLRNSSRDR